ncbi:hypothetical protein AGMMS49949_00900 [Alphaproteobacteria bacterium]|nr:hypothetical protein AGMMS49949_00900 [Alphaproteobacteria bacterium]GHS96225.1 hypothetical protein AGMMS50296_2170 [Alphaproteobacteria bacterium]
MRDLYKIYCGSEGPMMQEQTCHQLITRAKEGDDAAADCVGRIASANVENANSLISPFNALVAIAKESKTAEAREVATEYVGRIVNHVHHLNKNSFSDLQWGFDAIVALAQEGDAKETGYAVLYLGTIVYEDLRRGPANVLSLDVKPGFEALINIIKNVAHYGRPAALAYLTDISHISKSNRLLETFIQKAKETLDELHNKKDAGKR